MNKHADSNSLRLQKLGLLTQLLLRWLSRSEIESTHCHSRNGFDELTRSCSSEDARISFQVSPSSKSSLLLVTIME
ncbi:hypothetical protein MPTK1_6g19290 [Marchantia polymorpha subsp. ruderalis]|uniref:Uncharacterized protein n=2 Tax=Marchantia polymorpha TaxID=3197 RepID=A0AAF6BTR4_MARPO|nr:hypothetical protein MARPO_0045s0134 [Marchantia polymorpha]BBN15398.1 hypothetical protein Mp_6g19290 [Marchantia polymorpha subsp. ruderalis]|eukprot:PTQ39490.1 hypothetical protein MARPO_0045s0134 [Marchantia polymorpha]